ncbi:MAG: TatD family hydrolase [Erysipelotrichaceae bacterium]|nr:TatD family hydrolase [Erysipelotrichaceae bacterium]
MIFNTHSHINDRKDEIDYLIDQCLINNVNKIAAVGYDLSSSKEAILLARKHECIYAIAGLQPEEISSFDGDFSPFVELFNDEKCIAIGEIGLDYYYGKDNKERQLELFEKQLQIACNYKKPVVIHCRDAYEDTYNLLKKYCQKLDGIILHCYSGSKEMMERFLSLNAYISLSGVVTFKNAKVCKEVAYHCPIDKLLVETDDPYLTPVPYRGKTNQPDYVRFVVNEIANIKNMPFEEVARVTYQNAMKVFHL